MKISMFWFKKLLVVLDWSHPAKSDWELILVFCKKCVVYHTALKISQMGFWMDKQFWIFRSKFKAAVMLVYVSPKIQLVYTIKRKTESRNCDSKTESQFFNVFTFDWTGQWRLISVLCWAWYSYSSLGKLTDITHWAREQSDQIWESS